MTRVDEYREALRALEGDWEPYLLDHSGLPGPRGNLELAGAAAELGTRRQFERWLAWDARRAPFGSREEFLAFCGTVGLGRLAAEGDHGVLERLRALANDPRWRVREAVAIGLQRLGAVDMSALLRRMRTWANGTDFERRAAAAALCEPALLRRDRDVRSVLVILDRITAAMARSRDRRSDGFQAMRKGLAYCWSVAVAASPEAGRPRMERWLASDDPDVRWVMKQNLAKKRLAAAGHDWVASWRPKLG
ncbi:MAG TPA: hypothetical protein VF129_14690 [Actinomycetota bacterium]